MNQLYALLAVEELFRLGVRHFCVAPGSRSTALAMAVALHPDAKSWVHFDERGLGFFALGLAKGSAQPVAIITTSGTAVANLLPAVIEAYQSGVPLLIISADRPPELQQVSANQTIDQTHLFGRYAKWFFEMPCMDSLGHEVKDRDEGSMGFEASVSFALDVWDQAVTHAMSGVPGPVHVNWMFREPFWTDYTCYFESSEQIMVYFSKQLDSIKTASVLRWLNASRSPFSDSFQSVLTWNDGFIQVLRSLIARSQNGLVVVGELSHPSCAAPVWDIIRQLNWPVFADILSQVRFLKSDQLITAAHELQALQSVDLVLHFGGRLVHDVSRLVAKDAQYVHLSEGPQYWNPLHRVTHRGVGNFSDLNQWVFQENKMLTKPVSSIFPMSDSQAIPSFVCDIAERLPENALVFLGNSLTIRWWDRMVIGFSDQLATCWVAGNRGASGIDGLIATAVGMAVASKRPLVLMLGDLSALHDLNSLTLLHYAPNGAVVIVPNNRGGDIFGKFEVARNATVYDRFFKMSHNWGFESICLQFGLSYMQELPADLAVNHPLLVELK